jgi:hypothetical protein
MPDLHSVPDNIIDLDQYRDQRTKEGTWPPTDNAREYWRGRRGAGAARNPTQRVDPTDPRRGA